MEQIDSVPIKNGNLFNTRGQLSSILKQAADERYGGDEEQEIFGDEQEQSDSYRQHGSDD